MLAKTEKTGTQSAKKITPAKLKSLVKAGENTKKQTSEISGTFGELVNEAVDKHNLDKTAFALVRRLNALSPEKLNNTLPALLAYIDDLDLENKAASAPALPIEGEDAAED